MLLACYNGRANCFCALCNGRFCIKIQVVRSRFWFVSMRAVFMRYCNKCAECVRHFRNRHARRKCLNVFWCVLQWTCKLFLCTSQRTRWMVDLALCNWDIHVQIWKKKICCWRICNGRAILFLCIFCNERAEYVDFGTFLQWACTREVLAFGMLQ